MKNALFALTAFLTVSTVGVPPVAAYAPAAVATFNVSPVVVHTPTIKVTTTVSYSTKCNRSGCHFDIRPW